MEAEKFFVQGEKVQIKSSRDAIKLGMAWVTEDRKQEGLILEDTLVRNLSLPTVHKHRKAGIIDDNFLTKNVGGIYSKAKSKDHRRAAEGKESIWRKSTEDSSRKVVIHKS